MFLKLVVEKFGGNWEKQFGKATANQITLRETQLVKAMSPLIHPEDRTLFTQAVFAKDEAVLRGLVDQYQMIYDGGTGEWMVANAFVPPTQAEDKG